MLKASLMPYLNWKEHTFNVKRSPGKSEKLQSKVCVQCKTKQHAKKFRSDIPGLMDFDLY